MENKNQFVFNLNGAIVSTEYCKSIFERKYDLEFETHPGIPDNDKIFESKLASNGSFDERGFFADFRTRFLAFYDSAMRSSRAYACSPTESGVDSCRVEYASLHKIDVEKLENLDERRKIYSFPQPDSEQYCAATVSEDIELPDSSVVQKGSSFVVTGMSQENEEPV